MMTYRPFKILSPLHKSLRQIDTYLEKRFRPLGFSVGESHLLGYLLNNSPSPLSKLIVVFGLKNSTLTSIITRLEEQQLLKRKINPSDKRSFEILLTTRGKVVARQLYEITRMLEDHILERISEDDLLHLQKIATEIESACI